MKAKTEDEKEFVKSLQKSFPNLDFEVDFIDGILGLEDMSEPYWYITVKLPDGTSKRKCFYDEVCFRTFGDTKFRCIDKHLDTACDWLSQFGV